MAVDDITVVHRLPMQHLSLLFVHKIAKRLSPWLLLLFFGLLSWCFIHQSVPETTMPMHIVSIDIHASEADSPTDCSAPSAPSLQDSLHLCEEPLLQSENAKPTLAIWLWLAFLPLLFPLIRRIQPFYPQTYHHHLSYPPLYLTTARLRH